MLTWPDLVWNKLFEDMPQLKEGEGFKFKVVEGEYEPEPIQ
jgi:hypothetical protein